MLARDVVEFDATEAREGEEEASGASAPGAVVPVDDDKRPAGMPRLSLRA